MSNVPSDSAADDFFDDGESTINLPEPADLHSSVEVRLQELLELQQQDKLGPELQKEILTLRVLNVTLLEDDISLTPDEIKELQTWLNCIEAYIEAINIPDDQVGDKPVANDPKIPNLNLAKIGESVEHLLAKVPEADYNIMLAFSVFYNTRMSIVRALNLLQEGELTEFEGLIDRMNENADVNYRLFDSISEKEDTNAINTICDIFCDIREQIAGALELTQDTHYPNLILHLQDMIEESEEMSEAIKDLLSPEGRKFVGSMALASL